MSLVTCGFVTNAEVAPTAAAALNVPSMHGAHYNMGSTEVEAWSTEEWDRDALDAWGTETVDSGQCWNLPTPVPLIPMSIPFLALPRELRDMIYRYLLSIKYTKDVTEEPARVSQYLSFVHGD